MAEGSKLLVVDDEEVICKACRRIFSRQGFAVETFTDAREGLKQATENDYAIILLDIKMPNLDGIQFLELLREKKPEAPVLILTGYPSIPNAAAAMRLGASDYVTKPFTPEEVTRAVQRVVAMTQAASGGQNDEPEESEGAATQEIPFFDHAWMRIEQDGSACMGTVLPGLQRTTIKSLRLPRIGEVVYQGLPMAGISTADKPLVIIPAPVSGVIAAVNEVLSKNLALLIDDPCGEGWMACICTTRYEEEAGRCKPRRVVLANTDRSCGERQTRKLQSLGCQVRVAATEESLMTAIREPGEVLLLLDDVSFGDRGPELVRQINMQAPAVKIVVIGAARDQRETAYRKHRILYYAVEPFTDNEIVDILDAAFCAHEEPPTKMETGRPPADPLGSVSITNRNGNKVQLLAAPGLLRRSEGLGCEIARRLHSAMLPIVMAPGYANITPSAILKAAGAVDRLMVLLAKDSGQIPGSLTRDTKAEIAGESGETPARVTTLVVQPDAVGGLAGIDPRTISGLADHIVHEMASF